VTSLPEINAILTLVAFSFGMGMLFASWLVWRSSRYVPHFAFNAGLLFVIYAVISIIAFIAS